MELKVEWSEFAQSKLQKIFKYYLLEASEETSNKLIYEILNKTKRLKKYPDSGRIEKFESEDFYEFRSVNYKSYKIIYTKTSDKVYVLNVFDMRRNPDILVKEMTNLK